MRFGGNRLEAALFKIGSIDKHNIAKCRLKDAGLG